MERSYNEKMKELLYQYAISLENYAVTLNNAAEELDNEKAAKATLVIEEIAHKCRGSGGVYGFDELSQKAGQLEDYIINVRKKKKIEKVEMHLLSSRASGFGKYCKKISSAIKESLRFDIEAGTLKPEEIGRKTDLFSFIRGLFTGK